jgi:hypothetical protein
MEGRLSARPVKTRPQPLVFLPVTQQFNGTGENLRVFSVSGRASNRERAYRGGRCEQWVRAKNRKRPAFSRVADADRE